MLFQKEDVEISDFASGYADSERNLSETLPDSERPDLQFEQWVGRGQVLSRTPKKVARIERNRRWLVNLITFGLILLIGILPLLLEVYSDKPLGTPRDYLAAFVLGAGAAIVAQLEDIAKQLWGRLKS